MRRAALFLLTLGILLSMGGCGSQSSAPTSQAMNTVPGSVPVSLTVTDTPPAGVTVLFFQLSVTGATLSPGNVSLLSSTNPIPVNVSELQADTAFLGTANVPAGTYTGLNLTFGSDSKLTIFNNSGAAIGSGASACANDTVCILTPTATNLSLSFSTAPFPVTLAASTPLAIKLDIHLDKVIQSDLSVDLGATNGVSIDRLQPTGTSGGPMSHLGHLMGTVESVGTNQFTLLSGEGRTFTIGVNSSTTYDYPSSVCSTANFACLAAQQIVKVEVSLATDGTLLASDVDYAQAAGEKVVEGNIIRLGTSGGNTLMDLILKRRSPTATEFPFGYRVTVTVPPTGVTYAVDSGTFTIPSGLAFAGISDLAVGQQVQVVVQGSVTTASGSGMSTPFGSMAMTTFTTSSIKLEPSQITGLVAAVNASQLNFTLSTMPHFFVPPAATAGAMPLWVPFNITVDTTTATTFLPTTLSPDTIMGLKVNDVASVKGWVFSSPSGTTKITLAADTVLDRGSITPLF